MSLPPFVTHAVLRPLAHAATTHVVPRGEWRRLVDFLCAQRLVDRAALSKRVIAHPFVIDVIVIVDMWNGQAELILLGCISRDPVLGLGQTLATDPHSGKVGVFLDVASILF